MRVWGVHRHNRRAWTVVFLLLLAGLASTRAQKCDLRGQGLRKVPVSQRAPVCETVDLQDNLLGTLQADAFALFRGVTKLILTNNSLVDIHENAFRGLNELQIVHMDFNNLTRLPAKLFYNLPALVEVSMFGNRIAKLPPALFIENANLKILNLGDNALPGIPKAVRRNKKLVSLTLASNNIRTIKRRSFAGLAAVRRIFLQHNRVRSIAAGAFEQTPALRNLWLQSNRVEMVTATNLRGLNLLDELLLSHNRIGVLPEDAFASTPKLNILDLQGNPFPDECSRWGTTADTSYCVATAAAVVPRPSPGSNGVKHGDSWTSGVPPPPGFVEEGGYLFELGPDGMPLMPSLDDVFNPGKIDAIFDTSGMQEEIDAMPNQGESHLATMFGRMFEQENPVLPNLDEIVATVMLDRKEGNVPDNDDPDLHPDSDLYREKREMERQAAEEPEQARKEAKDMAHELMEKLNKPIKLAEGQNADDPVLRNVPSPGPVPEGLFEPTPDGRTFETELEVSRARAAKRKAATEAAAEAEAQHEVHLEDDDDGSHGHVELEPFVPDPAMSRSEQQRAELQHVLDNLFDPDAPPPPKKSKKAKKSKKSKKKSKKSKQSKKSKGKTSTSTTRQAGDTGKGGRVGGQPTTRSSAKARAARMDSSELRDRAGNRADGQRQRPADTGRPSITDASRAQLEAARQKAAALRRSREALHAARDSSDTREAGASSTSKDGSAPRRLRRADPDQARSERDKRRMAKRQRLATLRESGDSGDLGTSP